jgi:hypothetical protein
MIPILLVLINAITAEEDTSNLVFYDDTDEVLYDDGSNVEYSD